MINWSRSKNSLQYIEKNNKSAHCLIILYEIFIIVRNKAYIKGSIHDIKSFSKY